MAPPTDAPPKAPRMSIKFNAPSKPRPDAAKSSRPHPPSTLGKRPRHHALGGASDSESDYSDEGQSVTVFGDGARLGRDGRRRGKSPRGEEVLQLGNVPKVIRPPEPAGGSRIRNPISKRNTSGSDRSRAKNASGPVEPSQEMKWGLNLMRKPDAGPPRARSPPPPTKANGETSKDTENEKYEKPAAAKTADEEAMDRLLGKTPETKDKIIPVSEEDAYQRDMREAPPPDALDADTGIEAEEFGAAMLRGMGWDGDFSRPSYKQADRRPNQLGLGAKELKAAEDLGGWNHKGGKGGSSSRPKRLADYNREKAKEREAREKAREGRSFRSEREQERERERDRDRDRRRDRDDRHRHRR